MIDQSHMLCMVKLGSVDVGFIATVTQRQKVYLPNVQLKQNQQHVRRRKSQSFMHPYGDLTS